MGRHVLDAAVELCREHDLLPRGGSVLCAVSGGADSVCLLHWLNALRREYGFALTAAHYNHKLRGSESLRDAEFVRSFVAACCPDVPLIMGSGDVAHTAAQRKAGIEETAREMRYAFLQETARSVGADVIATAHHADDNAETVLLHLMRGSGLRGLTGISPRRNNIVRPLLTCRRDEIEAYLHLYGLPHVEDSSNSDLRFARNRVRHQLIPLLQEIQPRFLEHMTQTARLLCADEDYLCQQAQQALPAPLPIPGGLSAHAPSIAAQPDAVAVRMVRRLLDQLRHNGGQCAASHLLALVALCRSDDPSGQFSLPDGLAARRVYDRLELMKSMPADESVCRTLPLPGQADTPWGCFTAQQTVYQSQPQTPLSFYLSCALLGEELLVRSRRTGDLLSRPGRAKRPLKKILIDEKIPRHRRDSIPVLDWGGAVAAVAGFGPDAAFLPTPGEPCWHITCTANMPETQKGSL